MNITKFSKQYVVDASVAVKWLSSYEEENIDESDALLDDLRKEKIVLYAPDLIVYEIINALLKGKKLDKTSLDVAIETFFDIGILLKNPYEEISKQGAVIAHQLDITFYDAIYLALAQQLRIPLISANPRHHKKQNGVRVVSLNDWGS